MTQTVLFLTGPGGSGKTSLAKAFVFKKLAQRQLWTMVDKDTTSKAYCDFILKSTGHDPNDRDSPWYKEHLRDLDYQSAIDVAEEQLDLGFNVVMPGPWTKEIENNTLNSKIFNSFSDISVIKIGLLIDKEELKKRILKRGLDRDAVKLKDLDSFVEKACKTNQQNLDFMVDCSLSFSSQLKLIDQYVNHHIKSLKEI